MGSRTLSADERGPLTRWLERAEVREELRTRDSKVDGHCIKPRPLSVWEPYVPHPAARKLVKEYEGRTCIRRSDLGDHASDALAEPSEETWIRAYMACQLWGIGCYGRVHWTRETLNDPAAPAAIAELADAVRAGKPELAADRWATGWNVSFTTKFAYAVSKALDRAAPAALIYDGRVRAQLERIGWQYPESRSGRVAHRRYGGYLDAVHAEASEIGCQPDTIEWVLFCPPK